jgi:hypothetical protein
MIYVASPYTSPLKDSLKLSMERSRYQKVLAFITKIAVNQGPAVFSPIAYYHPIAVAAKLPTHAGYWNAINMQYLRKADLVYCLMLPGWKDSQGVKIELNTAKILGIPVIYFDDEFKQVELQ